MIDFYRIATMLHRKARACITQQDGGVAMMFALALLPIVIAAGVVFDYSRASNARSALAAALDSTVLAFTQRGADLTDLQLREEAERYFAAVLDRRFGLSPLPLEITRSDNRLAMSASGTVPTGIMKLAGTESLLVATAAEASFGTPRNLEIALVLDNTLSMEELNKMTELKKAALNLVNAAERTASTRGVSVKVALVPFSFVVKLDPSTNRNAPWLATREQVEAAFLPPFYYGTPFEVNTMARRAEWTGCIADRGEGYRSNLRPSVLAIVASLHPAEPCRMGTDVQTTALPLTSNWAALRAKVNAMTPAGLTNITIGARFGFAALSPAGDGPLGGGVPFGTRTVDKYIILMTDGINTLDRTDGAPQIIDPRTQAVCNDIKSRSSRTDARGRPVPDVRIFTIRVIEGNSDLLRNCATEPSMYREVTDPAQMDTVFQGIMQDITGLKLTK